MNVPARVRNLDARSATEEPRGWRARAPDVTVSEPPPRGNAYWNGVTRATDIVTDGRVFTRGRALLLLRRVPRAERDLLQEFLALAVLWKRDKAPWSSLTQMVLHPAYQRIIGMGLDAVPLILQELEREPDHWFWALNAITGENPVPNACRGDLGAMTKHWLAWGRASGTLR